MIRRFGYFTIRCISTRRFRQFSGLTWLALKCLRSMSCAKQFLIALSDSKLKFKTSLNCGSLWSLRNRLTEISNEINISRSVRNSITDFSANYHSSSHRNSRRRIPATFLQWKFTEARDSPPKAFLLLQNARFWRLQASYSIRRTPAATC